MAEIEVLNDYEYVRIRPEIFVGSCKETEEKAFIIEDLYPQFRNENYNIGLYKIFQEILDNAFDSLKRAKAKNKNRKGNIHVKFDDDSITVTDTGEGFENADKINEKSKLTNIVSALSLLRAGSNFRNKDNKTKTTIIGNNGIGAAVTNILSSDFSVVSTSKTKRSEIVWKDYKIKSEIYTNVQTSKTGTTITFKPDPKIFGKSTYQDRFLLPLLLAKSISGREYDINVYYNGRIYNELDYRKFDKLSDSQIYIKVKSDIDDDLLVVNGSICTGIITKIIKDEIKKFFKSPNSENYFVVHTYLNLPPEFVDFNEQNKIRLVTQRYKLEPLITPLITKYLRLFSRSRAFNEIQEAINTAENIKSRAAIQKQKRIIDTRKFVSSLKNEYIFIVEGDSAKGSIMRSRDPKIHSIFTIRGKIPNVRTTKDVADNNELMQLIKVLGLHDKACLYKNVVIATDADPDGFHIASLLVNFFYNFYPDVIKSGVLKWLRIPLYSYKSGNKTKYAYMGDNVPESPTGLRYLKGLGALNDEDWKHVFENLPCYDIVEDKDAKTSLELAFNKDSDKRKLWLTNQQTNEEEYF